MSATEPVGSGRRLRSAYFDALYAERADPWDFESSGYEHRKYEATLTALGPPERRFGRAFEAGCSIGVFTQMLAWRCDRLLAVDLSAPAVERARERLRGESHVQVERMALPDELPGGQFDLVLFSEVLYYWDARLLTSALDDLEALLAPGASLVAVHWRPPTRDYPLRGDAVHDLLRDRLRDLVHVTAVSDPSYRLDRWDKRA